MTRRHLARFAIRAVLAAAALLAGRPVAAQRAPENQSIALAGVATIGFTVADLERSMEFFTSALGFAADGGVREVVGSGYEALTGVFGVRMRVARLRLGDEILELTEYLAPEGRPMPVDTRSQDRWFQHVAIVVSDMDAAYRRLREHKVRHASTGPQLLPDANPNAGGIRAFYFKDPDGHFLELIWFPPGKGDPRWQRGKSAPLFLGIDHTAIVVRDTETSLRFYRDLLGFSVAGQSRNFGTEQAHLNNVEGASLLITGLKLPAGPGVELLEYITPSNGRDFPADARANDILHWQTTFVARRADELALAATMGSPLVSRGVAELPDTALGFRRGVMLRDADGHVVRIVDR